MTRRVNASPVNIVKVDGSTFLMSVVDISGRGDIRLDSSEANPTAYKTMADATAGVQGFLASEPDDVYYIFEVKAVSKVERSKDVVVTDIAKTK